jgi:hypothetical protein
MQYETITQQQTVVERMELVIVDEFHPYKTKNSLHRRFVMKARTGLQLQVTVMLGFQSLCDQCY